MIYSSINQEKPSKAPVVEDFEAVLQSFYNIISTPKYSRIFNPNFGTGLEDHLFDLINYKTALSIKRRIWEATHKYDPRISYNWQKSTVEANLPDKRYDVFSKIEILGLDTGLFENMFYLEK